MDMNPAEDPTAEDLFFSEVRQGHVFELRTALRGAGGVLPASTTHVAVVSQSCDVIQPKRPTVTVAVVASLEGDLRRQAANQEVPRYVHLAVLGPDKFADLSWIHSYPKQELLGLPYEPGIDLDNDNDVRSFALATGRWFSRAALPNDVVPWLQPLVELIRDKYRRPASPLGRVLADVVEVRVEAEHWSHRPLQLTLHVIVRAGTIPTLDGDDTDETSSAAARLNGKLRRPTEIAEILVAASKPVVKATLWPLFAESLADCCKPKPEQRTPGVDSAVGDIVALISDDDEFPLSRIRMCELLDLDYLSDPYPV